jgi:hypothetical protein
MVSERGAGRMNKWMGKWGTECMWIKGQKVGNMPRGNLSLLVNSKSLGYRPNRGTHFFLPKLQILFGYNLRDFENKYIQKVKNSHS